MIVRMKTFEQLYCERYGCDAVQYPRRLFYATLPWRARICAWILGGFWGRYFSPERDLIADAGEATSMARIRDDIRDYFMDPVHQRWLRRGAGIRLSTRRLQRIALSCGVADSIGGSSDTFR